MKRIYYSNAIRITLSYLIFGIFWIILSDKLVELFVSDSHSITIAQTYKGWAFIIVTSLLLFFLLVKVFNILQNEIEKHKSTIALLQNTENKFRLIFENSGEAILLTKQDGSIEVANPEACKIFNRTPEEICKIGSYGLVDVNDPRLLPALEERKRIGSFKGELKFVRKDGTSFTGELTSNVFKDFEYNERAIMLIRDITKHKLAEEELRESNQLIEGIINSIPIRVFWKDKNLVYLGCNTIFAADAGFSNPQEIIGKDDFQMVWRDQAELYRNDDRSIIESGRPKLLIEEPQTTPEGKTITLLTSKIPLRNSKGEIIGLLGIYIDITERKLAEEKLQESEELFRLTAENLTDVIFDWDIKENIDWYGDIDGITGYPPGGFPRTLEAWAVIVHPDDKDRVMAALEEHLKGVATYLIEYRVRRRDGEWCWWSARGTVLRNDRGEPHKMIGSITDITERRLAQEKLQESEEKYKTITQSTVDVIFISDEAGKLLFINESVERVLGYKVEEVIGKSLTEFVQKKDLIKLFKEIKNIFEYNESSNFVIQIYHKDGHLIDAEINGKLIKQKGKFVAQGSIRDITDRKQTEKALRDSEAKLKEAQRIGRLGSWDWDIATDTTTWSEEYYHIYGFDPKLSPPGYEEHLKMYTPESAALLDAAVKKSIQNGEGYQLDLEQDRTNGSGRWVTARCEVKRDDEGKIVGLRGTAQDITEHKQAEEKIKIFSAAVEDASDCFVLTDMTGDVTYANKSAIKTFGYSLAEILKLNVSQFSINPEEVARMIEGIRKKDIWNGEINSVKKNKEIFPVILSISLIKNDNDNPIGMMGVFRDITEQKHAATQLMEAKEKAEEMNRLKSNFLANMSHELRTPLVGILGFADILRQDVGSQETKEMADTIYKSGKRLSETLNLILDLSKFESEKWDIEPREIDLVSKTEEIINSFEGTASKKGLTLKSSFSQNSIIINFDERAFHSILNNLINNALKFTSEGSVTTTISLNNDFVEIKVIDTGIGIAEKDYQIIFEEFRQVSEGYSRNFEGSGLGLSITKKLIEKFGGSISVESEVGKGSTFTVILPVINIEENEKDLTLTEASIPQKFPEQMPVKPLALLVDDDPYVFTVLKRYTSEYIELDTTLDAEFAFMMLKNKKYDIIFMDINLRRGLDGKEVTRKIRTMKGYETIPIIATTAYAMAGDKEEFLAAGCTHYLSKPFSKLEIAELLEKVFKPV